MPLNKVQLAHEIADLSEAPGPTPAACAQRWATVITAYMLPLVPFSTTVAAAQSALRSGLEAAFSSPAAAPGMESALAAFAATVAGGMTSGGFVGAPPPAPVGFATKFAGSKPATHQQAGAELADLIDTWARTGLATPVLGGPPVQWS